MELLRHGFHGKELQSPVPASPNSSSSSSSSSSNGGTARTAVAADSAAPVSPKLATRSMDANPCPTTFIQADTSSFKQVVQMLTGSAETTAKRSGAGAGAPKNPIPPAAKVTAPKKPSFKLYERRSSLKNLKMISPLLPAFGGSNPNSPASGSAGFSPRRQPEILSPSVLDLPSLTLSPVTPLIPDPFNRSAAPAAAEVTASGRSAEEQAIAEKGFYLHPSPRSTQRDGRPPRLLPLFPMTSPRTPSAQAAGASI